MTIGELIKRLADFDPTLSIGSFQTHDQGRNEGNEYPWEFIEFEAENFEVIDVAPTGLAGELEEADESRCDCDNLDHHESDCPYLKRKAVLIVREGT